MCCAGSPATPDLAYDGDPVPLTGGFWAELVTFRLVDPPTGWDGALVARVMPDAGDGRQGDGVPGRGRRPGLRHPQRAGLGRTRRRGRWPGVHGHDPRRRPAAARRARRHPGVGEAAVAGPPTAGHARRRSWPSCTASTRRRSSVASTPTAVARPGLDTMLESLREHLRRARPGGPGGRRHAGCRRTGPSPNRSWSATATCTRSTCSSTTAARRRCWTGPPPCWRRAPTTSGSPRWCVASPPLVVPRALRPVVAAAGRALSRRFVRAYERAAGHRVDPASLAWHQGVVCVRALVEVAGWVAAGTIDGRDGHPWVIAGDAFAARLARPDRRRGHTSLRFRRSRGGSRTCARAPRARTAR